MGKSHAQGIKVRGKLYGNPKIHSEYIMREDIGRI